MGEESVHFVREVIVNTRLAPSELRRVVAAFHPRLGWRLLWLDASTYLAASWSQKTVIDHQIDSDDVVEFARSSDRELHQICTVASVVFNNGFSISALPDRFVAIFEDSGNYGSFQLKEPHKSVGPEAPVMFKDSAVPVLADRPEATRIFYDGNGASSYGRKVTEYFRVIEAGFGVKGGKLKKCLLPFLQAGAFAIDGNRWERIKSIRDNLNHAYVIQNVLYDSDVLTDMNLVWGIAADVLVHKKIWGQNESSRVNENHLAHYLDASGAVNIAQGHLGGGISMRILDSATGTPINLSAGRHNLRYRRYADTFLTRWRSRAESKQA